MKPPLVRRSAQCRAVHDRDALGNLEMEHGIGLRLVFQPVSEPVLSSIPPGSRISIRASSPLDLSTSSRTSVKSMSPGSAISG